MCTRRIRKGAKALLKESAHFSDGGKSVVQKERIFRHLVEELEVSLLVAIVEDKYQILGQSTQPTR